MADEVFGSDYESSRVDVGRSAVRELTANAARVEQSAVQRLEAETVEATSSAFGVVNASTLDLKDSAIGVAVGYYVKIEEGRVFILLAPRVSGNVKAFLTLPAAFAFGAGFFVARRALTALLRRPDR